MTSLFFKLEQYSQRLFDCFRQSVDAVYDKVTGMFEFPINRLEFIVSTAISYDSVEFSPLEQHPFTEEKLQEYAYKGKPFKHQLSAIEYGLNHSGWLLLDECGLGKTSTMIFYAEYLKQTRGISHCLIICGVNSLKFNWLAEIQKFSKYSCRILGDKVSKNGRHSFAKVTDRCKELAEGVKDFFTITNIETLQSSEFATAFKKSKVKYDLIVVDEIHHCKSPTTKSAKTLLKLSAPYRVGLTGTLIMNVPENAYIPLKWTGNTKSTFSTFKSLYNVYGGFGGVQVIGHKNLDLLKELLKSCSLRRLKSEVIDLPPKNYIYDYVEMGTEQRKLYGQVEEGVLADLSKLDHIPTIIEEITINMRLRQISAYPGILSNDVLSSAKLDRLCELAEEIIGQGDKLAVFGSFKGAMEEAFKRLSKYNPVICTGDISETLVDERKAKFQNDPNVKVFIGTWQKCGTGHTLNAANYLVFIDTPWTDSDFQQCADRIHRIGQNKPSFIITLLSKDTYDERVKEIVERKESLSGFLIDDKTPTKLNLFT